MPRSTWFLAALLSVSSVFGTEIGLYVENDALLPNAGDTDYTHGTMLYCIDDAGYHTKVQQNMYTPSDLRRSDHIEGDRPYCGLFLGSFGHEFFEKKDSDWIHYGELSVGVVGPSARCEKTQKWVHKQIGAREPKGWEHQLHDEAVVNVQWWETYDWKICKYVALLPRAGVLAGNLQDAAEVGCDLRLGWNVSERRVTDNGIMFSAPKDKAWSDQLSFYVFGGASERYYLYNHILEGSMFNHKDDDLKVDIEPWVTELRCGCALKFRGFTAAYTMLFRSDEFKHQKNSPDYGSISIGYCW